MEQTAVEWLVERLAENGIIHSSDIHKAKEIEGYNDKQQAKKYYLKGFEDAELTESQNCSHEQTMKDAESFFELVYPIKL
jgi:hypothetical protein